MTGSEYEVLIASYVLHNFGSRDIEVYRKVFVGRSVIGKNRNVDILVVHPGSGIGLAIECKYQGQQGTTDEKIPYALDDLRAMRMPGVLVYAGEGLSTGVVQLLRASELAAFCFPADDLARSRDTIELDHVLAMNFAWWDLIADEAHRFHLEPGEDRA